MSASMLSEVLQRALARFGLVGLYETNHSAKALAVAAAAAATTAAGIRANFAGDRSVNNGGKRPLVHSFNLQDKIFWLSRVQQFELEGAHHPVAAALHAEGVNTQKSRRINGKENELRLYRRERASNSYSILFIELLLTVPYWAPHLLTPLQSKSYGGSRWYCTGRSI